MKEQECFPNRLGRVRGFRRPFTISAGKWSLLDLNIQRMKFCYPRLNPNWTWIRRTSGLKNADAAKRNINRAVAFMTMARTCVGFMIHVSVMQILSMKTYRLCQAALTVKEL